MYRANELCNDGTAALQQALAGDTFHEKERRLSEMILQLQMVREQLVSEQEQAKVSRVNIFFSQYKHIHVLRGVI